MEESRCPRRPLYDEPNFFYKLFGLFSMYKDGFLPEPGGINSQPALLVEYFAQIKHVTNALDAQDAKGDDNDGEEPDGVSLLRR